MSLILIGHKISIHILFYRKFTAKTTIPSEETKHIKDSLLPEIFLCEKSQLKAELLIVYGYEIFFSSYLKGSVAILDYIIVAIIKKHMKLNPNHSKQQMIFSPYFQGHFLDTM